MPHLSSSDASLQLSEDINFFALCRIYTGVFNESVLADTTCLGAIIYTYTCLYTPYSVSNSNIVTPLLLCPLM
jgi:hypothetical protein